MRRVDINGHPGNAAADGVDETWVMNPAARQGDPAAYDGAMPAVANVREYLVAMPTTVADLAKRVAARRATGTPAVVRICPGAAGHGYPLEAWAVSPIPEFCEREELSVAVDFGNIAYYPWSEIVAFARTYPRLAVIALATPLGGPTAMRALDATPNLVFDTSGIATAADLTAFAELVRTCGAYRVAFGSGIAKTKPAELARVLSAADAATVFLETAAHLDVGTWASEFL